MPRQRFRRETGRGARDEHGFLPMDRNQQKLTDKKSAAGFTAVINVYYTCIYYIITCVYIYIYMYVCISPRCLPFSSDQFSMDNGVGLKQFKDVEVQPWKFMKVQVNLFMCPGKMAGFPLDSLGDTHGFPPCSHHAELCRNWCNNLRQHALRNYFCGPRLKATSISISSFRVIIQYFIIFRYISNRNEVIWLPKSFRLRWRSTTPPSTALRHWAACITYKNTPFNTKESPTMWLNWTQWK